MVFESVVADVLNRFLGDYVENLDGSQLKLGIWGGDVVLKDLRLKDSALQDLDLPIKTVSGYLGKLVLKIPWKNLYTAPVVVLVERLHLLAVPSQGVTYSREKEDTISRDLKKQQISRFERRQQLADTSEKLKENDDSFVEKLATQIIKNVQVTVKDIHIRYEDQITAPDTPFALGITLHTLCLESTDNHWKPAIVTDTVKQIYKLVSLDSLSVYWNSRTQLYGQLSEEDQERRFLSEIATSDATPDGTKYILGPINAKAQLKLNPKPEHDGSGYKIPKVWLNLVLQQLAVGVTKYQYRDMIELLQSMERMTLAQPYRKYRPQLTEYHGNATKWWRFAYKCVLNEMVRRRRRNWSWVHMKAYRDMCQRYAKAYKTKLTTKKVPPDVLARIDDYEFKLDIVNVIMIRQKVQLEVDRQLERQKKEKKEAGWFGGWFGGGSKTDTTADDVDIAKQFEAAMTSDERQKLYAAIDYEENAAPTEYPAEFEAVQLAFRLDKLCVSVEDEESTPAAVLRLSLSSVDASLAQRPAAAALRLEASINDLRVDGVPDGEKRPAIATTRPGSDAAALVTAMFETNPLDGECDQRLRMRSQPVEMIYHAETISRLAAVFRPPRHVQLSQLQAAAISKLHELKETSTLKMQYAIETHKSLDLEIDLMASQVVVPEFGDVTKEGRRLALNLGSIRLRSAPRQVDPVSVRQMASQGTSSEDIFNTMAAQAYDQFDIDLEDIEVVVSVAGESWREALKLSGSPQHLVRPISLSVCVKKCLITDDPRLPVIKVDAAISKLSLSVSDYRLIQLATLANSIPSPTADDEEPLAAPQLDGNANVLALDRSAPVSLQQSSEKRQRADEQITDLLLNFSILELTADVYRRQSAESQSMADEMISLMIGGVGCTVAVRTHTMEITSTLAGVTLKSHEFQDPDGGQLYLVSTPMTQGRSEPLLSCKYTKVDRGWDKFRSEFGGVAQVVELNFSELTVQLHQAALCSLMAFGDALSRQLSSIGPAKPAVAAVTAAAAPGTTDAAHEKRAAVSRRPGSGVTGEDDIDVRLDACFNDFRVHLSSSRVWVAGLDMANLHLGAELRPGRTQLTASLSQFSVTDMTPDIKRDKVLSMTSDEVFRAELQLYNRPAEPIPPSFVDLELSAQLGGARLLFTNRFITDVLAFLQPFSATQAALAEASQTAAEAAQLAMQNAYAQAFKAKLNITMKAPVIVVPQNSSSDWALVADLGNLSVNNSLQMGPQNKHGAPSVLDVMTLKLDNLQFSRGRLGSDGAVQSECLILKPVTMSVQVTRNLSTSWYREKPEIDILATLGDLAVVLSEQDYAQIMRTLTENLSEPGTAGLDALPPTAAGQSQPAAAVTAVAQLETTADVSPATAATTATAATATATAAQDGVVFTKLKFSFDWTFVGVELFVSSTAEKTMEECKSSQWSLGKFGLHQLSVTGRMESDGALQCRVSLEDCVLQDTRADTKTCFPRLMEKVTRAGKPRVRMIDVQYSQKACQDRDLQARVSSVSLILFLPYLMMLMEFFTKNMPEQQPDRRPVGPPAAATKPTAGKPQRPTTLEAPRKNASGGGTGGGAAGLLTLQLTVDRPDIALVEDLSDINTRAVVFDNEIQLKVQQTPEKTNVMGDINRIQLFTCIYNPAEREATMNEIVSPFSVSVMGGLTQTGDTHLQLEVTEVKLHVNAAAIHLLTSISSGLTSAPARPEDPAAGQPAWTQLWDTRDVHSFNFWFLQAEMADEAVQDCDDALAAVPVAAAGASRTPHREELIFKVRSLSVTVEQVVGARNVPLVLLDASFEAQVKDWSAKLLVESSLKLELAYYNSLLAAWEPIIECVERREAGMVSFSPWELHMKVERNEDHTEITSPLSPASVSSDNGAEAVTFQPPVLSIHISTKDPLEVTVTRTCLDVLTELQESLANALELTAPVADETDAHFLIRNQLDHQAVVYTNGQYTVHGSNVEEVVLDQGAEVPLMAKDLATVQRAGSSSSADNRTVRVKVPSLDWMGDIPVTRAESRFFRLQQRRGDSVDSRGLLADIRAHFDSKIVTMRSCVQVENHQTVPVKVYYMNNGGNELQCVGVAEPHGLLALPLSAVYSNTAELFFGVEGYTVSVQPFVWRELQNSREITRTLKCETKKGQTGHPLYMLCHGEMKPVFFESSRAKTLSSRSYRIHLRPPAVLSNLLPVELTYLRPGDLEPVVLPPGGSCQMSTAQTGERVTLQMASYLDRRWSCSHLLETPDDSQDGLTVWTFLSGDGDHQADLSLGMHTRCVTGSLQMALYAPFWMINRTGKMLTYKTVNEASNLIYHPETFSADPVMFSFKPNSFFSKKKASVRVEDSEWSDKFSLDTVGSGGTVTCASHNWEYGISVQIQLSRSGLTRQVYFLPSVVVANNAPYDIQIHEPAAEEDWITIPSNTCSPLWPRDKNKELRCRVVGTTEDTTYLSYKTTNDCLLHLNNKYGGISTSVQVDEASTIITLDDYVDGMATVRIINHTNSDDVAYHQRPFEKRGVLKPSEVTLYTWERPTSERTLSWSCGNVKGKLDPLVKDGIEEFESKDGYPLYWVSFLDGMQRTLMFTADLAVATQAHNAVELERIDQEITVEIEGVGLSLVNNVTQTDVMYLGITSSGVVWETQKARGKRFRAMTSLQCALLERAHQNYETKRLVGANPPNKLVLDNKMEVDFAAMQLLQPNRRYLRRTFQSGLWLQLRASAHQRQLHAKLNRFQLDNQLRDSVFPVVLAPVPPPKSIAADSVPKAFVEMSVVERLAEHTTVTQFKYCKMLIQEFHVKLDQGFITALVDVFSVDKLNRDTKELVESDLEVAREELKQKVAIRSLQEQRNFFDFLHFSPLKIHVSFSMTGGGGSGSGSSGGPPITSGFLQLLLQSVGVTLTEIQDVVFKLAYFQREHQFLSQSELTSEVTAHYTGQAVKQLYVLVLGLDVIGNPFGLVVGLTDGVSDLFYEPVQGAIQGPGEFAEGLALGVTSLFSHAVGGTAGAVSRITGTLGKGIAALTLDQDYQQKRREAMNRRPNDFTSGIAQSGRGLFMGVVDGVTGVVKKPIEGAQEEGALGFVKGMGKGMVGLFTRPTSGVVDFASGSFDAVKRTMDQDEVTRLRPSRHFQADRIIRPYVRHEAEGAKMLMELEKGRYASTDTYVAHAICRPDRRVVFLLTDHRVMLLSRNEIFGNWQVDWTYMWKELTGPPKVIDKGLELRMPATKRGFGLFGGSDGVKLVPITDHASAQWMRNKVEETMRQYNVQ